MLPPGRARLATIPARSGSPAVITIGIVVVAPFAAIAEGVATVTIASGTERYKLYSEL
jgi:hypothetical protein